MKQSIHEKTFHRKKKESFFFEQMDFVYIEVQFQETRSFIKKLVTVIIVLVALLSVGGIFFWFGQQSVEVLNTTTVRSIVANTTSIDSTENTSETQDDTTEWHPIP